MGVSSGAVSEWINGKRRPIPQTCIRLAEAFDVDPDTVLAIAGHRSATAPLDDPKADLIALIRRADLSPETIYAMSAMVREFMRNRDPGDHSS
jgi:transcriptional regulator with XRE-family HTH domain